MRKEPTLHFISGKLGSGKTTLAKKIAEEEKAIFISEDIWLEKLFPTEITDFSQYLVCSKRFRKIIETHVAELLTHELSVVFDFAGNTLEERNWIKSIINKANADHILHYIDATDELCRSQFKKKKCKLAGRLQDSDR